MIDTIINFRNMWIGKNKFDMNLVKIDNDIHVFYVEAYSFPEGITDAYERLSLIAPWWKDRRYFWLSWPENWVIKYKAAAQEKFAWEWAGLGCKNFTIRKGDYLSVNVIDYKSKIPLISDIFQELTSQVWIDPNWYCLEFFLNENDIMCMVPLKPNL